MIEAKGRRQGQVKFFNSHKGFGFIVPEIPLANSEATYRNSSNDVKPSMSLNEEEGRACHPIFLLGLGRLSNLVMVSICSICSSQFDCAVSIPLSVLGRGRKSGI
jgi:hypothetical protein